jgi:hypothetical protein
METRFIDNGDGTITDTQTNLIWQQDGYNNKVIWAGAVQYSQSLGNNWRLPTVEELFVLADRSRCDPAIDPIFNCNSKDYWSSSSVVARPDGAWYVYFYNGFADWNLKSYYCYVRCVRDGQV